MVNTAFEIDEPVEEVANEIAQYRGLRRSTFQEALETERLAEARTRAEFLAGGSQPDLRPSWQHHWRRHL